MLVLGCNKFDSEGTINGDYIENSSIEQESKINYPVYISQSIDSEIASAIAKRTKNSVNSTNLAKVAFITDDELTEELAENFCDSNKVLVLLNPSDEHIKQFAPENTKNTNVLFIAYNADGEHCMIPMPVGNITYSESMNGLVNWINDVIHNDLLGVDPQSIFENVL